MNKKNVSRLSIIILAYYILAAWVFVQFQAKDTFFDYPIVDEKTNLERAAAVIEGNLSKELFWQEPASFLYFALLRVVGLDTPAEIKGFQIFLLNPLVILLVYWLAVLLGRSRFAGLKLAPDTDRDTYTNPGADAGAGAGMSTNPGAGTAAAAAALYAFCPLPIFLSLTIMKTLFTICIYLLCFIFYFKFYYDRTKLKYGLLFVLSWFIAWWTRQHILLMLPIFFVFLALPAPAQGQPQESGTLGGKEKNRDKRGEESPGIRNNVALTAVIVIVLVVASLSLVTAVNKKQMLSLTTNGRVNFYIANNPRYEETVNMWPGPRWQFLTYQVDYLIDPYAMVTGKPGEWLLLLARKGTWEFTPYADFRQFYWGYYESVFPYFKLNLLFNLFLLSLSLAVLLHWRKLSKPYRLLLAAWLVYHIINIIMIPGIARYNTVILPVTILLALENLRLIITGKNWKIIALVTVLAISLLFIRPPNEFKQEFYDYLSAVKKMENKEKCTFTIPPDSKHQVEWLYLQARCEFDINRDFRRVIEIIQSPPVRNVARVSSDFCQLLDYSYMELGLYYDALSAHEHINLGKATADRLAAIRCAITSQTEEMIAAYRRENLLTPAKANEIALFLVSVPPFSLQSPGDPGTGTGTDTGTGAGTETGDVHDPALPGTEEDAAARFEKLLDIAGQLVDTAMELVGDHEKYIYLDTKGMIAARRGHQEESRELFRRVYNMIADPIEKEKYRRLRLGRDNYR